jgi:hypothetical protein
MSARPARGRSSALRGATPVRGGVRLLPWTRHRSGEVGPAGLALAAHLRLSARPADTPGSADRPESSGRLDITYPEHLSRGLVLVKSWLLAIPHYLIVGFFIGGAGTVAWTSNDTAPVSAGGGLVALLVLFAGIALLVRGRYPQGIFDAVLGMDRWAIRVAAYAA